MGRKVRLADKVLFASKAFRLTKTARFGIIVTAILSFLIFAISFYGMEAGNFTFTVDQRAYQIGVSLYENLDNKQFSTRLLADKVDNADGMTDLCGIMPDRDPGHPSCIPPNEEIHSVEGSNNGESYIAYTFYVEMQSNGNYAADLLAEIDVISTSKGAEEALRVKVIIDGEATVYAKRQSENGQNPGELEPYVDQSFFGPSTIMRQTFTNFFPGDIKKVSVVIWYEGYDPDHTINLWSGGVKLAMNFTVTNIVLIDEETS
ncbi:hypothetical protein HF295_04105 [Hujiaoplasma nucleasis]|uniref:Uncharacterized protein n=1 Tax=Hujiaoplasma nucleasis TaxID=2725268 RepID=A0A7L6N497_9MOLU|nr:hypothetical protein [Hujiaoplasma nucleasis]QLY40087.1 hypothetical protein HF295_04105 [Hujiaoplasma nucleasis]